MMHLTPEFTSHQGVTFRRGQTREYEDAGHGPSPELSCPYLARKYASGTPIRCKDYGSAEQAATAVYVPSLRAKQQNCRLWACTC